MKTEKEKKQLKPNTRSMLKYKCSFGERKKKKNDFPYPFLHITRCDLLFFLLYIFLSFYF